MNGMEWERVEEGTLAAFFSCVAYFDIDIQYLCFVEYGEQLVSHVGFLVRQNRCKITFCF